VGGANHQILKKKKTKGGERPGNGTDNLKSPPKGTARLPTLWAKGFELRKRKRCGEAKIPLMPDSSTWGVIGTFGIG